MNGQTHAFPSGRPAAHAPWWGARGRGLAGEQPLQHAGSRRSPTFSACRSQTSMCLFLGSSFCCWSRSSFSAVLSLPPSPLVADMPATGGERESSAATRKARNCLYAPSRHESA